MTGQSPAIEWVRIVAQRLGDLREDVVFLGGAIVGLLITDRAAPTIRPTEDVDVIVEAASWGEYATWQEALRGRGFDVCTDEGAPICRWVVDGIRVDVMPTAKDILGFSNRWYGPAMDAARKVTLDAGTSIHLITAPYFLATKIEAFHGRGDNDYQISEDIEDLIAVVDGRPELIGEIDQAEEDLRDYLRQKVDQLSRFYGVS